MKRYLGFIWNRWSLLTLVFGLAVSALLAWQLHQNNEQRVEKAVAEAAARVNTAVIQRLELYQYGLRGARGAVLSAGDDRLSRELFHRYSLTRDIDREFPGARGFGFIRRVSQAGIPSFVEQARADGWPDFRVRELNAHDGERYVIQYVEPVARNIEAVGLDIASEKTRRAAADAAMRTGEVRLSGPITLVQASGKPLQSFLIIMPVYRNGITPATPAEREQQAFGWSYAPLLMEEVLSTLRLDADRVQLKLFDVTEPGVETLFYSNATETDMVPSGYTETIQFDVFGRRWESRFDVSPAFVTAQLQGLPLQLLLLGSLISLLAASLIGSSHLSRQRRRQVLDEQARLVAIVESSADGIIGKTLDGVITSWNRGAEQIFGYSAREAIGQEMASLVVPEDRQAEEANLQARVNKGENIPHFDTVRQRQDGHRFHVSVTVSPIRDGNGRVIGASKTVRDITSQKETEARVLELNSNLEAQVAQRTGELTTARDQLLMAADVAELGVWTWNLADNSLDWNDKMFELYGYPVSLREQGVGYEHWHSRLHPDDAEHAVSSMEAAVQGTAAYDLIFRLQLPDGGIRYMQAGAQIERDAEGQVIRITGTNLDITQQRELETRLRQAKAQAEEASAAKSTFLANMSHEIRTPMNAVLGMLQLVQQTALNQRQLDYVGKADIAARSLLGLLNDILDYSKIEAGKLQLEQQPFELEDLMQELAVVLSGTLGTKPVELMFDLAPSLPSHLIGDRLRLQQILINLAGNAIKFTEAGDVVVHVGELSRDDASVRLCMSVSDTGIGIAEDKIEHILEAFSQAEASTARRFGGTGLGLVISKRLLELMDSKIQVSSTPGVGSRFWFEITLALADTPSLPTTIGVAEQPLRVLVVDDHPVSAEILARAASLQGWQASIAYSGHAAVTEVEHARDYDLVLMDWAMPGMNGLEAAARIRELDLAKPPTIIMITAYGREQLAEAQQELNPPFVDFLTKPVTTRQLVTTVRRALSGAPLDPEHKPTPARSLQRLEGLRLLVVEDNAFNRQVAAELLAAEGARVELAEGGLEGVSKVVEAPTAFDMVLMDMQMPDIDGLEATRRIRADVRCQQLPILAMTANVTLADQQACLAAGMNAHIGKPVDIEHLVAVLLSFHPNTDQLVSDPVMSKPVTTKLTGALTDDTSLVGLVEDMDTILRRFGGNASLYRQLLLGFENNANALFDELEARLGEQNIEATAAVLHTFKGIAGTMGAAGFATRMAELETQLKEMEANEAVILLNDENRSALKALLIQSRAELLLAVPEVNAGGELSPEPVAASPEATRGHLEQLLALLDAGNLDAIDCFEQMPPAMLDALSHRRKTLAAEVQNLNFTVASNMVRELLEAL